jgi:hypothetical protein
MRSPDPAVTSLAAPDDRSGEVTVTIATRFGGEGSRAPIHPRLPSRR